MGTLKTEELMDAESEERERRIKTDGGSLYSITGQVGSKHQNKLISL